MIVMYMESDKPETPFMTSLVGGVFVLVDGTLGFMLALRFGSWPLWLWEFKDSEFVLGPLGIFLGALIIVAATLAYSKREFAKVLGVVIVISSVLSLFIVFGGYIAGFVFGLIGGILFVVWEPAEMKNCMRCGKEIRLESLYCPYCGLTYAPGLFYALGQPQQQQVQPGQPQPAPPPQVAPAYQRRLSEKNCGKCGARLLEGARFCSSCGQLAG